MLKKHFPFAVGNKTNTSDAFFIYRTTICNQHKWNKQQIILRSIFIRTHTIRLGYSISMNTFKGKIFMHIVQDML